jgi:hypothetical protein
MKNPASDSPKNVSNKAEPTVMPEDTSKPKNNSGGAIRSFVDFFVLFSGISTASNLARTQGRALLTRGVFLFRRK